MSDCGFIGLGRMGGQMAQRLLEAGHRVTAFDVSAAACDALAVQGACIATSARAVADAAPIVFLSLPSPASVVETVLAVRSGRRVPAAAAQA